MKPLAAVAILLAIGFGASGCSREKEVVLWLRKAPRQFTGLAADVAEQLVMEEQGWRPVQRYESWEEWALEGRRISGCEEVLLGLCKEKEGESGFSRSFIAHALAFVGTQKSVPVLLDILQDENEDAQTRSSAAVALGGIGAPEAVQPLLGVNRRLRWFGKSFEEESSDESDETLLKFNVLAGLAMIEDPRVRPVLEAELQDPKVDAWHKKALLEVIANPRPQEFR